MTRRSAATPKKTALARSRIQNQVHEIDGDEVEVVVTTRQSKALVPRKRQKPVESETGASSNATLDFKR